MGFSEKVEKKFIEKGPFFYTPHFGSKRPRPFLGRLRSPKRKKVRFLAFLRVRGLADAKNPIPADLPIYEEMPDPFPDFRPSRNGQKWEIF